MKPRSTIPLDDDDDDDAGSLVADTIDVKTEGGEDDPEVVEEKPVAAKKVVKKVVKKVTKKEE
jgi:hypothetical protein